MKRRLLVPMLALLGLAGGLGYVALGTFPAWLGGAGDLGLIHAQIADLEAEVADLERQAELLEADPFAIERAIREDLRMAKGDEVVIHLTGSLRSNPRFP